MPAAQALQNRSNVAIYEATPGKCDPKQVCISNPLVVNLKPNELAYPQCINIYRCGGCCVTGESCMAHKTQDILLTNVGIIEYDELTGKKRFFSTSVMVRNHTSCVCDCQFKNDDDCAKINKNFVKNPDFCECSCPDKITCGAMHEFDAEQCQCLCKKGIFDKIRQSCKMANLKWNELLCRFIAFFS